MGTLSNETTQSQQKMILQYMEDFGSITPAEAMEDIGCYRLGARIYDLKHRGYTIRTEMVEKTNRFGKKVRVASYSLEKEAKNASRIQNDN